ncbi:MAG: Asp-tRNA(Asn)/Glu-tRNA(Gln) amidotransferase subunit GatC [Betaproteobacteria bacterium]|nr:Asp-tRNA(Asn)/Glu-tRNA(Gln) amidotransferase subunit GatC [Betaproteobacteria bacterium]
MALTLEDVARIAHLARIHISQAEAERTLSQLNDIFAMIEQMQAVDTSGVEPMAHPLGGAQRLRDDRVTEDVDRTAHMRNAPEQQEGLFLVPRVVE